MSAEKLGLEKDHFILKITTLSFLHIKSEEIEKIFYARNESEVVRLRDSVVFLSDKFLPEKNFLFRFFRGEWGENGIIYKMKVFGNATEGYSRSIRVFTRHPNGTPYIPASSVKGALRNLITMYLVFKDKNLAQNIDRIVNNYLNAKKARKKVAKYAKDNNKYAKDNNRSLEDIIEELFTGDLKVKSRSNKDCLRALVLRDLHLKKEDIMLVPIKVFRREGSEVKKVSILAEALRPEIQLQMEGFLDRSLLERLGCPDILETLKKALEFYNKEVVPEEIEFIRELASRRRKERKELEELARRINKANLHVGFGGSLESVTLFRYLKSSTRERILKLINPRKKDKKDYTMPYTRKFVVNLGNNSIKDVIGWVKVEIEEKGS